MTVLVDTSIIVDHLRDDRRAVDLLTGLVGRGERLWAATPTRTEIVAGLRPHELAPMQMLFSAMSWVDITTEIADAAGEFARRYHASHVGIDTVDYLIAAAAQSIDATILTLNVRHFPMFSVLEPAYR